MAEKEPLGFDAVAEPPEDQSSYTVEFASSDPPPEKKTDSGSEEIGLLDRQHGAMSPEDKVGWSGGVLACILPDPLVAWLSIFWLLFEVYLVQLRRYYRGSRVV